MASTLRQTPRQCACLSRSNPKAPSRRHHRRQSTKASISAFTSTSASASSSNAPSTSKDTHTSPGTWPNSFEPLVLDSRYIGHYRDPSKHDSFTLPVSKRGRAAWFAPSTVNPIVGNVHHGRRPQLPPHYSSEIARNSEPETSTRTSKARDARRAMEKAWGAPTSDSLGTSTSASTPTKNQAPPITALLMPGSGSQYVGMASFLDDYKAARETWEEAEYALSQFEKWRKDLKLHELPELKHLNLLDWPTWQKERSPKELETIVRNGPQDELTRSSNSQPAICITSIALLRTLEQDFGIPLSSRASFFAGHSSGEYSACVASGVLSFTEGVHLTRLHGLLTSRALQLSSLKAYSDHTAKDEERAQMSAIMLQGDSIPEQVQEVIQQVREQNEGNLGLVEIASYNSSRQLVLSGSRAGVLRACEKLEDKGIAARAADLPVFAPFHCSFMAPAAAGMTHAWNNGVSARAPRAPIVSNLDAGLILNPERLKKDIVASIHKPVRWSSALNVMRDQGVSRFIFVGPGKALANLARKEHKSGKWQDWKEVQFGTVATEECMAATSEMCRDLVEGMAEKGESHLSA